MSGNDRFEGYCIDLLEEISKILGFNYTVYEVPDKMHGIPHNVTGEWNGIIRELKDKVCTCMITMKALSPVDTL